MSEYSPSPLWKRIHAKLEKESGVGDYLLPAMMAVAPMAATVGLPAYNDLQNASEASEASGNQSLSEAADQDLWVKVENKLKSDFPGFSPNDKEWAMGTFSLMSTPDLMNFVAGREMSPHGKELLRKFTEYREEL